MKELKQYITPYLKYVLLGGIFLLVEVIAETVIPKLMTIAVKNGINSGNIKVVIEFGILMVAVSVIGCVGGLMGLRFASKASSNVACAIRKAMFAKIQRLSLDSFDSASLTLRLGFDLNQIQSLLQMFFRILIRAPLLFCWAMIMASSINLRLTIVFWVTAVVAGFVVVLITKKSYRLFAVARKKLEKVNRIIKEDITGVKDIRALLLEESEKAKFSAAADEYRTDNTKALKILSLTSPISTMIVNLSAVPVLWFGRGMLGSSFAVEDIIAFTTYIGQILLSFMMISMVIMLYSKSKVSIERVNEVLGALELACGPEKSEKIKNGSVEVKDISFRYGTGNGKPVLDRLCFNVEPGSYVAVVGSTGSGKSTIAALLARMMQPSSGSICIDGININNFSEENFRAGLVPVFQTGELLSGSIGSNISSSGKASDSELSCAAQMAQIKDFVDGNAEKYDYAVSTKGSNLSGGQKQRLALARAFFKKGHVYIFDDCISALNPAIRKKIIDTIENMQGITRIVLTQRAEEIKNADKILLLEQGRITAEGKHEFLFENCLDYRCFCEGGNEING